MLKKILLLVCTISIIPLTTCMEDKKVVKQPKTSKRFNWLIKKKDEETIIELLEENKSFFKSHILSIARTASKGKLSQVADYIKKENSLDKKNLIICALLSEDIEKVIMLTEFNKYLYPATKNKLLMQAGFLAHLNDLGFKKNKQNKILNEIIKHNKKNYLDTSQNRYIHNLVRDCTLLKFINSFSIKKLNTQEFDGSTPLHIAAFEWQQCKEKIAKAISQKSQESKVTSPRSRAAGRSGQIIKQDKDFEEEEKKQNEKMTSLRVIIQALLERGASPYIKNRAGKRPIDLEFFKKNELIWPEWRAKYKLSQLVDQRNEVKIIEFLKKKVNFRANNAVEIIYKAIKAELKQVIDYMQKKVTYNDLINFAFEKKDFETIKQIIKFDNFILKSDKITLDKENLIKKLTSLQADLIIIDEIVVNDAMNYCFESGKRYLQALIQEQKFEFALRFIKLALPNQIDAQDENGFTSLHIAISEWEWNRRAGNDDICKKLIKIVRALVKNGAELDISNLKETLKDSQFFKENEHLLETWQKPYQKLDLQESANIDTSERSFRSDPMQKLSNQEAPKGSLSSESEKTNTVHIIDSEDNSYKPQTIVIYPSIDTASIDTFPSLTELEEAQIPDHKNCLSDKSFMPETQISSETGIKQEHLKADSGVSIVSKSQKIDVAETDKSQPVVKLDMSENKETSEEKSKIKESKKTVISSRTKLLAGLGIILIPFGIYFALKYINKDNLNNVMDLKQV